MKKETEANVTKAGLHIPAEILEDTTLKDAEKINVYGNESSFVMMNEAMTAMQIIRTVDMLNTVAAGLLMRLENAVRRHEENCRQIIIPEQLLELAGIPGQAPLRICADEGEINITVAEDADDDDPADALPSFLRELFEGSDLDFGALRWLLESEELIHE